MEMGSRIVHELQASEVVSSLQNVCGFNSLQHCQLRRSKPNHSWPATEHYHALYVSALCSWDRFGHGDSHHRGRDEKVTGVHTTTTETAYAGPVQNVRVVDQV
jgi:hypothetical protein